MVLGACRGRGWLDGGLCRLCHVGVIGRVQALGVLRSSGSVWEGFFAPFRLVQVVLAVQVVLFCGRVRARRGGRGSQRL